eukprot:363474-Chlamydomonas_euryale.AAC.26
MGRPGAAWTGLRHGQARSSMAWADVRLGGEQQQQQQQQEVWLAASALLDFICHLERAGQRSRPGAASAWRGVGLEGCGRGSADARENAREAMRRYTLGEVWAGIRQRHGECQGGGQCHANKRQCLQ